MRKKKEQDLAKECRILNENLEINLITVDILKNIRAVESERDKEIGFITSISIVLGLFFFTIPFIIYRPILLSKINYFFIHNIPLGYINLISNQIFYITFSAIFFIIFIVYPYFIKKRKIQDKRLLLVIAQVVMSLFIIWICLICIYNFYPETVRKNLPTILNIILCIIMLFVFFFLSIIFITQPLILRKEIQLSKYEIKTRYTFIIKIIQILNFNRNLNLDAKNQGFTMYNYNNYCKKILDLIESCKLQIENLKYL